jgi:hypothetical protein
MIVDSKDTLPVITERKTTVFTTITNNYNSYTNNNNSQNNQNSNSNGAEFLINSQENQLKYNFVVSSNANYTDPHLIAVYSSGNNKSAIQTNSQLYNSNSRTQFGSTGIHRLKSNSPLPANQAQSCKHFP